MRKREFILNDRTKGVVLKWLRDAMIEYYNTLAVIELKRSQEFEIERAIKLMEETLLKILKMGEK